MTERRLYRYQERVGELILAGKSVILQAPTGAGKTTAALLPYLHARRHLDPTQFPRKCIYSVPMRVLATQFKEEWGKVIKNFNWGRELDVRIQTGANSADEKLQGDLIFTTIDQTLSNYLNIPYALGAGQANLNAGAVLSSYLVIDELHLLDPDSTLPTTLHMLKMVRGVVPFLVMTATFSRARIGALADLLGAEPVIVSGDEAADIPSQNKTRCISTVDDVLTVENVLRQHQHRSIVFCNSVSCAQDLYEALRNTDGIEARLLHSRFLDEDRAATEAWLRREFGKDKDAYTAASAILVTTQAAEVGLDVTSERLHTEIAPGSSVLQRAGRCARYPGEAGEVFVYRTPLDKSGKPTYAPYVGTEQRLMTDLTWAFLERHSGNEYSFDDEMALVDEAHGAADQRTLETLAATRGKLAADVAHTMRTQDLRMAGNLIRDADSRTIILHPNPQKLDNPWALEGFSLALPVAISGFKAMEQLANASDDQLADASDKQWIMYYARAEPREEGTRGKTVWVWETVKDARQVSTCLILAANPALAHYSPELGLRLGVPGSPCRVSPPTVRKGRSEDQYRYQRETVQEHVQRMLRVWDRPFYDPRDGQQRQSLREELAYALRKLESMQGWPEGVLDRLARLVIATHDLGKLDVRWQRWAHEWQAEVSKLRGEDLRVPAEILLAHTDYDSNNPAEQVLSRRLARGRPNHAVEGAAAAASVLRQQAGDLALAKAALTAVMSHHAAGAEGAHGKYTADKGASAAFLEIMLAAGLTPEAQPTWEAEPGTLMNRKINFESSRELLPYLYLVRILRLADQRSQEPSSSQSS